MLWHALRSNLESGGARYAVGLMVGTSLDGIDLCLVELSDPLEARPPRFVAGATFPFEISDIELLRGLAEGRLASAATFAGCAFLLRGDHERALREFLRLQAIEIDAIAYVAAHGVTVSHRPAEASPHSWQLLDAEGLAARVGCVVFSNFRAAEVALGGHGAPLAPVVDELLRRSDEADRAILNLGGIANITLLPAGEGDAIAGDIGPANMPLDLLWRRAGAAGAHDAEGATASGGDASAALLRHLLAQPWLERPLPRSFGREEFGESWVQELEAQDASLGLADRLATVVELELRATKVFLERVAPRDWRRRPQRPLELFVTGGGVHNRALMQSLARLAGVNLASIAALGEDPDYKEAYDFAVLGWLRLCHRVASGQRSRGATGEAVLGSIHFPDARDL
jgi:anhydro-N-acetylmuramic acid kinase